MDIVKETSTAITISLSNISFTIMKSFWLFYSVGITLIQYPGNMDDDCGNNNVGLEEEEEEEELASSRLCSGEIISLHVEGVLSVGLFSFLQ